MKKVKYVKIIETHTTHEPTTLSKKVKFILKVELFKHCETIEEVRDYWYELRNDEVVLDSIEIYLYTSKKKMDKCEQEEGLAE